MRSNGLFLGKMRLQAVASFAANLAVAALCWQLHHAKKGSAKTRFSRYSLGARARHRIAMRCAEACNYRGGIGAESPVCMGVL